MSLLKLLQQAQGGQGLGKLAQQFGMDEGQAGGLAELLAPAIGSAAKKRAQSGGLDALLNQFQGEAQGSYFDNPAAAAAPEARAQGDAFLENLLGSTEARETLAQEASSRSGVDQGTVAQFLPALAALLQGGMQKQLPDSSIQGMLGGGASSGGGIMGMIGGLLGGGRQSGSGGGPLDMISNMLDADGDGSALDDILDRVMKR